MVRFLNKECIKCIKLPAVLFLRLTISTLNYNVCKWQHSLVKCTAILREQNEYLNYTKLLLLIFSNLKACSLTILIFTYMTSNYASNFIKKIIQLYSISRFEYLKMFTFYNLNELIYFFLKNIISMQNNLYVSFFVLCIQQKYDL